MLSEQVVKREYCEEIKATCLSLMRAEKIVRMFCRDRHSNNEERG
jgi:hypothetical protein